MGRPKAFDEREVIGKALELFWEMGYAATTLDMLTTTMGIARPSLYNSFGSKAELFVKCFHHYEKTEGSFLWRALKQPRIDECARLFVTGVVDAASEESRPKGFFLSLCMAETYCQSPQIKTFVLSRRRMHEKIVIRRFMRECSSREASADAQFVAATLFMIADGLSIAARIGHSRASLRQRCNAVLANLPFPICSSHEQLRRLAGIS